MYEAGFASQPESRHRDDGLELIDAAITGVAHCAPPGNKPTPMELANCSSFLRETFALMSNLRAVLALGRIAFDACVRLYAAPGTRPKFAHGAVWPARDDRPALVASFHPSQQNTFTGRLTPEMMRDVFETCRKLVHSPVRNRRKFERESRE